jgi:chemotaxis protein methyltransferase CheR
MSLLPHAAALIEQRTGLSTLRRSDIYMLLSELAAGDLPALLHGLRAGDLDSPIWQGVIRALAIGETYFFRDETHFHALRTQILPALIRKRRQQRDLTLNLWSVGCATGEEPYSLAMLLHDLLPDLTRWTINLVGTDINTGALEAARRGVYRQWSFRQTAVHESHHFERVEEGWQIQPHLRQMVRFQQDNLLSGASGQFDVIFCRNVLLYFSAEHAVAAEAVLRDALAPGGWLFLGHSESIRRAQDGWIMHSFPGSPIYQKPNGSAPSLTPLAENGSPAAPSDSTFDDAVRAYHAEQRDVAEGIARRLLEKAPAHARAWSLLACLAADRQEWEAAHRYLDSALELDPLLADAHYLRGVLYHEDGQLEAARQALRAALYARRTHALAGYTLGTLYAGEGEFDRAVKLWENARSAISGLPPEQPLSDISELTAGRLNALISEQLAGWHG